MAAEYLEEIAEDNLTLMKEKFEQLDYLWTNVGIDEDQKKNRTKEVFGHLQDLLKDIVKEEEELFEDIKRRIVSYEAKIADLLNELCLPACEQITSTLLVKEETLRQRLDMLTKMKHNRLKEFKEYSLEEKKYCKILGMPPLNLSFKTGVPTEEDIHELQQHVKMLKQEKEHRREKLFMLKKELTTILEVTELTPETPLEKEILTSQEDNLSLSNDTFKMLEQIVSDKKMKKADLEKERAVLIDKLSLLWDIMKVEKEEREAFLSKHLDYKVSSLNAIKEEIVRCEEIKMQNISKYIDALKEELSNLLEKCFISMSEKKLSLVENGEVDETLLETYDNEVEKWRNYYKDTEHIINKIKKWQKLWELMIVFENKANDPNRFKNRGGNLLQEERERKKLQKDLPALEEEIFLDIKKYEESGKRFLYFGENFEEHVRQKWDKRNAEKENEKRMRQKLRTKQLEGESATGVTPLKRTLIATAPKSAPSKLFKSSVGVPIYRTPNITGLKPVPTTTARMKARSRILKKAENILKQKNENVASSSCHPDSTTYTEFADKLDNSPRCRSSVLCSKKIGGTRISNSKRKSGKKSAEKSKKKMSSIVVTPARGKLGLPFLI